MATAFLSASFSGTHFSNITSPIDKFHNNRICSKRGNHKILFLGDNEILSRSFAMPTHDHCCVPQCTNRRNKNPELSYHTFPKTAELKKKWIMAIQRDEGPTFKVTNNTVVCSAHFVPSDYTVGQRQGRLAEGLASSFNTTKRLKRLKNGAVPSLFSFRVVQAKIPCRTLIRYTGPLPVYGPPTYTQHLEEALKKADSELDKAKNEVVKAKNEVVKETAKVLELQQEQQLSYRHLVEQENLHKQTNRKGNSDLEYYTGLMQTSLLHASTS
ncbi:THAP domain-containing protein 2-like [Dysidea avara]|uniref:THAP domain-containing protein 2-like n=1 Tax=Dysidea avara TaxID=196820 RepID=UPI0033287468